MTLTFTDLEAAILDWICKTDPRGGDSMRALLKTARITSRENTGHGFYTNLAVEKTDAPPTLGARYMDGPTAYMDNASPGMIMGFMLWFEDGYPDCLEGYQFSDVDLKTLDLADLRFTRLEQPPELL